MTCRATFICLLIGIACTNAYGDVQEVSAISFDAIYEYSKLKLDSASILLDRKGDSIHISFKSISEKIFVAQGQHFEYLKSERNKEFEI